MARTTADVEQHIPFMLYTIRVRRGSVGSILVIIFKISISLVVWVLQHTRIRVNIIIIFHCQTHSVCTTTTHNSPHSGEKDGEKRK